MNKKEKAYKKIWQQANPEKVNAYNKKWRKANHETNKARKRLYYKANSEQEKARAKTNYNADPEKARTRSKVYRNANPDICRESSRKRRAIKQKTEVETINDKRVFIRDGWICQICKKKVDKRFKHPNPMCATLDHIIPLSKGGNHTYRNVQLTHFSCNASKYTNVLPQGEQMRLF